MTHTNQHNSILVVTSAAHRWANVINKLVAQDYCVETAESGIAALSMLGRSNANLWVIDSVLKDIDALEVIRIIRLVYPKSTLSIMLVMQAEHEGTYVDVNGSDINDLLHMPADTHLLKSRISALLNAKHAPSKVGTMAACQTDRQNVTDRSDFKKITPLVPTDTASLETTAKVGSAEYFQQAIENGLFHFYYQPIVSLRESADSEGICFELFLRMQDEHGRLIRPGAFLPAAEQVEFIVQLDRWAISTALAWLASHITDFRRLALCCINLSEKSLSDDTLYEYINIQFAESGVPPHKICFEIEATAATENMGGVIRLMSLVGKSGCTFALDNVGKLLSLDYLNNFPAQYIKIDGGIVKNIAVNTSDLSTVKLLNEVAHKLGKKTVAEFVENDDILNKLKDIGVDYAQGYAIGRPLPIKGLLVESLAALARN